MRVFVHNIEQPLYQICFVDFMLFIVTAFYRSTYGETTYFLKAQLQDWSNIASTIEILH